MFEFVSYFFAKNRSEFPKIWFPIQKSCTMFVPICFQVWPIFRLQIGIFAELLPILWFLTPPNGIFGSRVLFLFSIRLNKNYLDIKECLKCIIKCLYQFVFKFDQFLDFKLAYLSNYWRFCDFDPLL